MAFVVSPIDQFHADIRREDSSLAHAVILFGRETGIFLALLPWADYTIMAEWGTLPPRALDQQVEEIVEVGRDLVGDGRAGTAPR